MERFAHEKVKGLFAFFVEIDVIICKKKNKRGEENCQFDRQL